jgi:hypothetical protein
MNSSIGHARTSESFDLRFRQILLDDLPNNLYIDVEVIVDDAISQTDDFAPLDLGMLGSKILRQAVGSFADNFQIAFDRSMVLSSFMKVS